MVHQFLSALITSTNIRRTWGSSVPRRNLKADVIMIIARGNSIFWKRLKPLDAHFGHIDDYLRCEYFRQFCKNFKRPLATRRQLRLEKAEFNVESLIMRLFSNNLRFLQTWIQFKSCGLFNTFSMRSLEQC